MGKMKKIVAVVLSLAIMVSLSGCTIFTLMMDNDPVEIATAPPVPIVDETETETETQKSSGKLTRTEFDENGKLMYTEHNY